MIVENRGRKSYIVKKEAVISGGKLSVDKNAMYFNPGDVMEIEDKAGAILGTYPDIKVLEPAKKDKGKSK